MSVPNFLQVGKPSPVMIRSNQEFIAKLIQKCGIDDQLVKNVSFGFAKKDVIILTLCCLDLTFSPTRKMIPTPCWLWISLICSVSVLREKGKVPGDTHVNSLQFKTYLSMTYMTHI